MGLDIYAGTLTRYYSHNWKTVVQQWAEENGYTFNRITPDGEPADNEEELSPAEVQAAVEDWRDQILTAISQPNQPPYTPWPEDNERPYYTDKPDWDAFGAMPVSYTHLGQNGGAQLRVFCKVLLIVHGTGPSAC